MLQKCSLWKVLSIFLDEPLEMHYIKEVARKIKLAHTSVRNHIKVLLKQELIKEKQGKPFKGFIANRESQEFLFYKQINNLIKLKESEILEYLIEKLYPKAIILYGSYLKGEDIEKSDIDIFILSNTEGKIEIEKFEKNLNRKIHIIIKSDIKKIPKELKLNIINGLVLYGYLNF